jgi:hypothetical protein
MMLALRPAVGQLLAYNFRVVGQIGGDCDAVQVVGRYAYISEGGQIRILDVTNTSSPIPLGRVYVADWVDDIRVSGTRAYVAAEHSGLQIIDVANPSAPRLLGSFQTPDMAIGVDVLGSYAYVAAVEAGLQILDVSNPSNPVLRGSFPTPGYAVGVRVSGNLAYVSDYFAGLQIIDVSNPAAPSLRGWCDVPDVCWGIQVVGGLVYLAGGNSGLQIIDVSNPSQPRIIGTCDTPGFVQDVCVAGTLAYVADDWRGIQIIDVSNPSRPVIRSSYNTERDGRIFDAKRLSVLSGLVYVALSDAGLQIVDVRNPMSPLFRGVYDPPRNLLAVQVSGGFAYLLLEDHNELRVVDVHDPSRPRLCGSYRDFYYDVEEIYVRGDLAYVAEDSGLMIIDVSNPFLPTRRGYYRSTSGTPTGIHVSGDFAYLATQGYGLEIVDVTDPAYPVRRGGCRITGSVLRVSVQGNLAYLADESGRLQIVDVSDPSQPRLCGSFATELEAQDVCLSGNLAYVAEGRGFEIIDVSNPAAPFRRSFYNTSGGDRPSISVYGGLAYIVGDDITAVDVANPATPVWRGFCTVEEWGRDVCVSNGLAYVASEEMGLWIVQYTGGAPRVESASIVDANNSGITDAGDQLVLTLDRSVLVTTSVLRASHFFLPVQGDSLGGAGFRVGVNPYNYRQIVLTMGQGVHLTRPGTFDMQHRTPGSPSGIDFAASLPFGAITSLDGISAIDGGEPGVDDSGVDIQFSLMGHSESIGSAGGTVSVLPSPDAAYTRHQLTVPAGALNTTTLFTIGSPGQNLGVIGAVQISSNRSGLTFAKPATIRVQYRPGDIDRERGQREWNMRVHQLVENPRGVFRYVLVPGAQTLNMAARQVSVPVRSLNPSGLTGGTTVFAGLPIETVDERVIDIAPAGAAIDKGQGVAVLTPGPDSTYTLHRIEFPGYVETSDRQKPGWVTVKIDSATTPERESLTGGRSFPPYSDAVFTVTALDASSQPVRFASPVHLTVQFMLHPNPPQADVVCFDSRPAMAGAGAVRVVYDSADGPEVHFAFADAPAQTVNTASGTVTIRNFVGLTGADGRGTFGAVAKEWPTAASRWRLYR